MKLISKIALVLILGLGCGFGQCIVDQFVNNLPIADVNGAYWTIYDLTDPENRVVIETDPSCMTFPAAGGMLWTAELGYWSPPPAVGDSLLMIGSWDSAYVNNPASYGDNQNHTGFYWLYSDIVDDVALTHWEDDTLRSLPQPIAAQIDTDIEISITNPAQTLSSTGTYNVLGYWIWADTTGSGTPNSYDKEVAFVAVQGGAGETTVCIDPVSNYQDAQTVYWAYKLVAQPDTGGVSCPGYSSYYLSANSNPIVIIGIEETRIFNPKPLIPSLEVYPNPFSNLINIKFFRPPGENSRKAEQAPSSKNQITMKIYDISGRVVKDFTLYSLLPTIVCWDGRDNSSKQLSNGVYFCQIKTENIHLSKQVVLLR
jgi:hypothetical protein